MIRLTCLLLVLAASSGAISVEAIGQEPLTVRDQGRQGLAGSTEPDPLPGLPRPPDQPNTLYQPAPAAQGYGCCDLECPYFERDPLLDPACLPHPGWLFDVETDILGTHVYNHVGETALDSGVAGVNVPMATLNWTVSPRFEAGYRLPSGFGEVDVSYRFLLTDGAGVLPARSVLAGSTPVILASPATLTSHFDMNMGDVDYAATETSAGTDMAHEMADRTADGGSALHFGGRRDRRPRAHGTPGQPLQHLEQLLGNRPARGFGTAESDELLGPGIGQQAGRRAALWPGSSEIRHGGRRARTTS